MPPRLPFFFGLRRLVYLGFLVLAWLRMLWVDRRPWRLWLRELGLRLGMGLPEGENTLWIHGEGMGEFNSVAPLIQRLLAQCPQRRLLLTSSRSLTCEWLNTRYPDALCLPLVWDLPVTVRHWFRRLQPRLLVLIEFADGFCPGVLQMAARLNVPVVVVNARILRDPRPRRYRWADRLGMQDLILPFIDLFCTQSTFVADELLDRAVAAERIEITGNLKYDHPLPELSSTRGNTLRQQLGLAESTRVVVAGCVHADEERLLLDTFVQLRRLHPELLLIVAPISFGQLASLQAALGQRGLTYQHYSRQDPQHETAVLLLDTFGELASIYPVADVVLLGGSFTPQGAGHSLIEPAIQARPIVIGPYTPSQSEMVEHFEAAGAVVVARPGMLVGTIDNLLQDPAWREDLGRWARATVAEGVGATERTVQALRPFLQRCEGYRVRTWPRLKNAIRQLALSPVGEAILTLRAHRVQSLDALRTRLGNPRSILCLGNGPSSEDPSLQELEYDCLFRVNWRWKDRGLFLQPTMVFTGDAETLRRCPSCVFGFRTIEEETLVLLHSLTQKRWRRFKCFTLERISNLLADGIWPARPTNGLVMVATAVALQPQKLILAGIDLFQHPEGKYPGESTAENRYAPVHDRQVEVAILRLLLAQFRGELEIHGDTLVAALARAEQEGGHRVAA